MSGWEQLNFYGNPMRAENKQTNPSLWLKMYRVSGVVADTLECDQVWFELSFHCFEGLSAAHGFDSDFDCLPLWQTNCT